VPTAQLPANRRGSGRCELHRQRLPKPDTTAIQPDGRRGGVIATIRATIEDWRDGILLVIKN
jgi:hypothetical protein